MKDEDIQFLPDLELEPLRDHLDKRIIEILGDLNAAGLGHQLVGQPIMSHLGAAFHAAGATEGTLWLLDEATEELVPVYNNGVQAEKMISTVRHPISSGLIGMVFSTEQSFCENAVYKNQLQDKTIDRNLDVITCAMIAAPVYFSRHLRGVISCVRLKSTKLDQPDPPAFAQREFRHIQVATETLRRLIEHRLYELALGSS